MKPFLSDDFLLQNKSAQRLYHEYAASMPIFDYHCHLPVDEIAADKKFKNLTAIYDLTPLNQLRKTTGLAPINP